MTFSLACALLLEKCASLSRGGWLQNEVLKYSSQLESPSIAIARLWKYNHSSRETFKNFNIVISPMVFE